MHLFGVDYNQYTSLQGSKRALPTSVQPQVPLVDNVGSSQLRESYRKTFSAQQKSAYGMNHMKSQTGRGSDDELIMFDSSGQRIQPPSHAKSISTSQHANSADTVFHSAVGEDRVVEHDERLIFQAALQVLVIIFTFFFAAAADDLIVDCFLNGYLFNHLLNFYQYNFIKVSSEVI